jgi:hypothetical protein
MYILGMEIKEMTNIYEQKWSYKREKNEKNENRTNLISKFLDIYKEHSLTKNIEKNILVENKGINKDFVDNFHNDNDTSFNFDFNCFPLI